MKYLIAVLALMLAACGSPDEYSTSFNGSPEWDGAYKEVTQLGILVNYPDGFDGVSTHEIDRQYSLMQECTGIFLSPTVKFVVDFTPKESIRNHSGYVVLGDMIYVRIDINTIEKNDFWPLNHEFVHVLMWIAGIDGNLNHKSDLFFCAYGITPKTR